LPRLSPQNITKKGASKVALFGCVLWGFAIGKLPASPPTAGHCKPEALQLYSTILSPQLKPKNIQIKTFPTLFY